MTNEDLNPPLTLASHYLCPYVQRAAIALQEKGIPFEREYIDLGNKPAWFRQISPLGKVPVLIVKQKGEQTALFESAAILEYLDETHAPTLHPDTALTRAEHRAWMEFGSSILNDIAGFYSVKNQDAFNTKVAALNTKFQQIEARLGEHIFFDGSTFSLVDTVFAPIFRYFDVFDSLGDFGVFDGCPKVQKWRSHLSKRESAVNAVTEDYNARLYRFLKAKDSYLSRLMTGERQV